MKKILWLCCFIQQLQAQSNAIPPGYYSHVDTALAHLQHGDCRTCLAQYDSAFALSRHSPLSHLRAAACAQLCQDETLAIAYGQTAVHIDWEGAMIVFDNVKQYPELNDFRQSAVGARISNIIDTASQAHGYRRALAKELAQLRADDQRPRKEADIYRSKYGAESAEYHAFEKEWARSDSICVVRAEAIIAQYGYPGKSMVGVAQQDAVWLVVQHAPLPKQLQYYPLIEAAAQKGEIQAFTAAMMLDRIRMYQNLPQVYGSQVVRDERTGGWKIHDVEDPEHVNERRKAVGLGPLEEYAQRFGAHWPPKD